MVAGLESSMPHATCSRWKTRHRLEPPPRPGKMSRVLVTGGAGFIGSHVADTFIANGWEVTIVDDLSSGKRENIPSKSKFHEIGVNSSECARMVSSGDFDVVAPLA